MKERERERERQRGRFGIDEEREREREREREKEKERERFEIERNDAGESSCGGKTQGRGMHVVVKCLQVNIYNGPLSPVLHFTCILCVFVLTCVPFPLSSCLQQQVIGENI